MATDIESLEFRKFARDNCYRYGCLHIYMNNRVSLDTHSFPNYSSSSNGSAIEKFLVLMQGLDKTAKGNDSAQKLPRMLPTVTWGDDSLSSSISLNGTMYFLDYEDYKKIRRKLRTELLSQGWTVNTSHISTIPITSYSPKNSASGALYADDPIDAAGMAMMANAARHTTAQLEVTEGLVRHDVEKYASGQARLAGASRADKIHGLAGFGLGGNIKAGLEAIGTNSSGGIIGKWKTCGHPIQLIIEGQPIQSSVNGVLSSAEFTEDAFVVDESSNGVVYPTKMEVSITVMNAYGHMLNTMSAGKKK